MNILWFSLSPCGSMRRNNSTKFTQTWMTTLEDEIKRYSNVHLSVAYFSSQDEKPFEYEGVTYYPMSVASHSLSDKIRNIWGNVSSQNSFKLTLMQHVFASCRPDIIHIHGTESCFGLIAPFVGDTPVIYSIQGVMSSISEKYYSGYTPEEASRTDLLKDCLFAKTARKIYLRFLGSAQLERTFLRQAKYVCGRTDLDHDISLLLNPERQYFVVNEIMRKEFMKQAWEEPTGEVFKLVSVLSAGIYKGYPTLLKTAALLTQYAGFKFEWNVIGCNLEDKWIQAAMKKTGVDPRQVHINLLGSQCAPEIVSVELDSHLYIHTGQTENSPNTVCEAMCLGMPIVATFAGGTPSVIEHKTEGFLVQDGDAFALAGAIVGAQKNYKQFVEYGRNARKRALPRHSPASVASELLNVYKQVVDK